MDEIDIWRTAKILIDSHGQDASLEAAMRADKALDDGLSDAVNVWMRIMKAIQVLTRQNMMPGELRH